MNIIPAILTHSFEEVKEKLSRLEGLVTHVQIDICDGVFGMYKTWLPEGEDGGEVLPSDFSYQFDVMVNDWRVYIPRCITHKASSIVAHVDMFSDQDLADLVAMIAPANIPLGISVSNDKEVQLHAEVVRKVQTMYSNVFIQVMGIPHIGAQGQFFDEQTPIRVRALREQFSNTLIQVDGGMRPETVASVVHGGAETIVVGSFLFASPDIGGALKKLELLECNAG